jgi:CAAX prenyl protease-like protein
MSRRPGFLRTIPFGLYIGFLVLDPLLQDALPPAFDERWLYGLRVGLVLVALMVLWRHYSELGRASSVSWREWALATGVGVAVFIAWINLDVKPMAFGSGEGFDPRIGGRVSLSLAVVRLAGAALVVPVMEELFWRSFLLRWLQNPTFLSVPPGTVGLRALLISSVLFATEHTLWFAGLLAGLAYGWLYKRSGNLWVPVVAHAVTNGVLGAYVLATGAWTFW